MLISLSLLIMMVIVFFSLVLGNGFIGVIDNITVANNAIINGSTSTILLGNENVLFAIDTTSLINSGIALIVTVAIVAGLTGVQVLGSGLSSSSVKIIIILSAFGGIWTALTLLAVNLIVSIEIFGGIIYIMITIAYAIGVIQLASGRGDT